MVTSPYLAENLTSDECIVLLASMRKVARDKPPAIDTDAGAAASITLELSSVTTTPPGGAGPSNVTIPLSHVPPGIVSGSSRLLSRTGATDRSAESFAASDRTSDFAAAGVSAGA